MKKYLVAATAAVLAGAMAALAVPAPAFAKTVREQQWYLNTLKIDEVHKLTKGAGVTVAVIDAGVTQHPHLAGRLLPGTSFASNGAAPNADSTGHGTTMALLIAGIGGSDDIPLGIAPEASILPVNADSGTGNSNNRAIVKAIPWAVDHGAKVINLSIAGLPCVGDQGQPNVADPLKDAVQYAFDHDVVIVAGNGNDPAKKVGIPACIPGIIAASALDETGQAWSGGTTGPETVLAAPGANTIYTAGLVNGAPAPYQTTSGTSTSTAIISGAAALLRSKYPSMSAADVIQHLIKTADDAGAPGRDSTYGFGKLNILKALTTDVPSVGKNNPLLGSAGASASAAASDTTASSKKVLTIGIAVGVGLILVILLIVFLALRRRRPATGPSGPASPQFGQGGPYGQPPLGMPPQGPGQYPPTPGHYPPQGQPGSAPGSAPGRTNPYAGPTNNPGGQPPQNHGW